jgi:L-ribulose-5-phosphate 4-epimerase
MAGEFRAVPKFRIEFTAPAVPDDPRLAELKRWCSVFHQHDLAPLYENGSFGNLSFRAAPGADEFFITATGLKLKHDLPNESFVKVTAVDLDRQLIKAEGSLAPSSESMLHYAIYNERKDVGAIFHGHSPLILKNGGKLKLPATSQEEPYGSLALVRSVRDILPGNNFIIMKNHGFLSLGRTPDEAGDQALKVLVSSSK